MQARLFAFQDGADPVSATAPFLAFHNPVVAGFVVDFVSGLIVVAVRNFYFWLILSLKPRSAYIRPNRGRLPSCSYGLFTSAFRWHFAFRSRWPEPFKLGNKRR